MIDTKYKGTVDLFHQPKKQRGGWRDGGRPKANYTTKMFRADTRLSVIIETLKARLREGTINEIELKEFEELAAN